MKNPSQRRRILRGGTISLVLLAGVVYAMRAASASQDSNVYGPSSGWDRSQMSELTERGSQRNPVLLPQELPVGVNHEYGSFLASNPITSKGHGAGRVWQTNYIVNALPPAQGNITGYTVYQEGLATPSAHRHRCRGGPIPNKVVTRRIGDDKVTICLGPHPTETARTYWGTVPFTDDLEAVAWLPDPREG